MTFNYCLQDVFINVCVVSSVLCSIAAGVIKEKYIVSVSIFEIIEVYPIAEFGQVYS